MNRKYPQSGIAQLLANKGREGDSMLVHMNPDEVEKLQQIAAQRGTSLTVNPHTGLPEAKNLWDYLGSGSGAGSLAAGAALGFLGFDDVTAGVLVGASQLISQHGDVGNAIVQGMSGYGGAQLEGMAENAIGNVGQKWDAFKAGWSQPVTKTTPTTEGTGVAEPFGKEWDESDYTKSRYEYHPNIAPAPVSVNDPETGNFIYQGEATPGGIYTLKPDTPTTIDAKTSASKISYIPDVVKKFQSGMAAARGVGNTYGGTGGGSGGSDSSGGSGGAGSDGMGLQNAMKLATLAMTSKEQEKANKQADEADAAAKASMPTPSIYVGNKVRSVQVRNPRYGEPGQPLYIQQYVPNTPTIPGARRGGLASLIKKKVKNFDEGGVASLSNQEEEQNQQPQPYAPSLNYGMDNPRGQSENYLANQSLLNISQQPQQPAQVQAQDQTQATQPAQPAQPQPYAPSLDYGMDNPKEQGENYLYYQDLLNRSQQPQQEQGVGNRTFDPGVTGGDGSGGGKKGENPWGNGGGWGKDSQINKDTGTGTGTGTGAIVSDKTIDDARNQLQQRADTQALEIMSNGSFINNIMNRDANGNPTHDTAWGTKVSEPQWGIDKFAPVNPRGGTFKNVDEMMDFARSIKDNISSKIHTLTDPALQTVDDVKNFIVGNYDKSKAWFENNLFEGAGDIANDLFRLFVPFGGAISGLTGESSLPIDRNDPGWLKFLESANNKLRNLPFLGAPFSLMEDIIRSAYHAIDNAFDPDTAYNQHQAILADQATYKDGKPEEYDPVAAAQERLAGDENAGPTESWKWNGKELYNYQNYWDTRLAEASDEDYPSVLAEKQQYDADQELKEKLKPFEGMTVNKDADYWENQLANAQTDEEYQDILNQKNADAAQKEKATLDKFGITQADLDSLQIGSKYDQPLTAQEIQVLKQYKDAGDINAGRNELISNWEASRGLASSDSGVGLAGGPGTFADDLNIRGQHTSDLGGDFGYVPHNPGDPDSAGQLAGGVPVANFDQLRDYYFNVQDPWNTANAKIDLQNQNYSNNNYWQDDGGAWWEANNPYAYSSNVNYTPGTGGNANYYPDSYWENVAADFDSGANTSYYYNWYYYYGYAEGGVISGKERERKLERKKRKYAEGGGIAAQYYAQGGGVVAEDRIPGPEARLTRDQVLRFANQGLVPGPGAMDSDLLGGLQTGLYMGKGKGKGVMDRTPKIKAAKKTSAPTPRSAEQIEAIIKRMAEGEMYTSSSLSDSYAMGGEIQQPGGNQVPPGYYPASGGPQGIGGHLLDGPGDGMSDSIPAMITGDEPQRAALADGEFVISADVVSHIGNGSTKAGAQKLYDLMDQIRKARTGTVEQAPEINPDKYLNRLA